MKVAVNAFLTGFVTEKLEKHWSPKQISGHFKLEYQIICSAKAIYKFAESRCLEQHLFWSWNKHKGGRKKNNHSGAKDGRVYVDERPPLEGAGHLEAVLLGGRRPTHEVFVGMEATQQKAHYRA